MKSMYRLLIYSPDSILDSVLNTAGSAHFACKAARDIKELAQQLVNFQPHAVLVVGKIAFVEGSLPIVRQMTLDQSDTGLVFLCTEYNAALDRECFLSGADHFLLVHTPYELIEPRIKNLCMKIQKLRDRSSLGHLPVSKKRDEESLRVSLDGKSVEYNGVVLNLSPIQHHLTVTFLAHADRLMSREDLIRLVWKNEKISSRSIDAQISKLKKDIPYFQKTLISLYGRGYLYRSSHAKAA